jgi:hypothetical protein
MTSYNPVNFLGDTFPVTLAQIDRILDKIDEEITIKEIDSKRQGYSVIQTLSLCMKNSIASVFRFDPRGDDQLLDCADSGVEPQSAVIDNCHGDPVRKVVQKSHEHEISQVSIEQSVPGTPVPSTRARSKLSMSKRGGDDSMSLAGGDKKVSLVYFII